jgi:hypothetical protein
MKNGGRECGRITSGCERSEQRMGDLQQLETQLRRTLGCWYPYRLRVWQECHSFDAASLVDRFETAKEVFAAPYRGGVIWAWDGFVLLLGELQAKLNDPEPHIRQDSIIALAGLGRHARSAVPILLDRLRSAESTLHDCTLAAWALPKIGANSEPTIPILLAVLNEAADQIEACELRRCAAEAIELLTDSYRTLVPLARCCLGDRSWKCRLLGLQMVGRLGERHWRLLLMLVPNVEPLVDDEVEEVREAARRIVDGSLGISSRSIILKNLGSQSSLTNHRNQRRHAHCRKN